MGPCHPCSAPSQTFQVGQLETRSGFWDGIQPRSRIPQLLFTLATVLTRPQHHFLRILNRDSESGAEIFGRRQCCRGRGC